MNTCTSLLENAFNSHWCMAVQYHDFLLNLLYCPYLKNPPVDSMCKTACIHQHVGVCSPHQHIGVCTPHQYVGVCTPHHGICRYTEIFFPFWKSRSEPERLKAVVGNLSQSIRYINKVRVITNIYINKKNRGTSDLGKPQLQDKPSYGKGHLCSQPCLNKNVPTTVSAISLVIALIKDQLRVLQ